MKNKIEKANLVAMIIGAIALLFGLYKLFNGSLFRDTIFILFIGASLFGTAYFNHREWKNRRQG